MTQTRTLLFLVTGMLLCLMSNAQTSEYEKEYFTEYLNSNNGLPQNSIIGIEKDENGYIWLATQGGLVRWDGIHFKINQVQQNNNPAPNQRVLGFTRTTKNELLAIFANWVTMKIEKTDVLPTKIKSFYDIIWGNEGYYLDVRTDSFSTFFRDFYSSNRNLFVSKKEQAYRTDPGAVFYYVNGIVEKISLPQPAQYFIFSNDSLFITTNSIKTYILYGNKVQSVKVEWKFKNGETIPRSLLTNANVIHRKGVSPLLQLGKNIYSLERKGNSFVAGFLAEISNDDIRCFYYDPVSEKYFIGTSGSGLIVLTKKHFKTITNKTVWIQSVHSVSIWNQFYAQVLYNKTDILSYDGIGFKPEGTSYYKHFPLYFSSHTDSKKRVWTALNGTGVKVYDQQLHLLFTIETQYRVTNITEDVSHNIWVSGDRWLGYIDHQNHLQELPLRHQLNGYYIENLFWKSDSILWISTQTGLLEYNKNNQSISVVKSMNGNYIRTIQRARGGKHIWLLTYGQGFYLYKDGLFTNFPLDKFKNIRFTNILVEDSLNRVWLSTNNGLYLTSIDNLLEYAQGKSKSVFYYRWNAQSGLGNIEFNGGSKPSYIRKHDGQISLPSMNGLIWFTPEKVTPLFTHSPIFIDEVFADNIPLEKGAKLSIHPATEQIKFLISTPHWSDLENLQLEYRFSSNNNWHQVENGMIFTEHMSSGNKRLEIRKKIGFEDSAYYTTSFAFTIRKKWHEKIVVRLAFLLLFLISIYSLIKWRTWSINQRKKELKAEVAFRSKKLTETNESLQNSSNINEMLMSVIAHEIRIPLRFNIEILKELKENIARPGIENRGALITELINSNEALRKYSNQILTWTNLKNNTFKLQYSTVRVGSLVDKISNYFCDTGQLNGNRIEHHIDPEITVRTDETLLEILLHNIIDNACKYTHSGLITLQATVLDDNFTFTCTDNGKGMKQDEVKKILNRARPITAATEISYKLGYLYINQILLKLNGTIHITSKAGTGTLVRVQFKQIAE